MKVCKASLPTEFPKLTFWSQGTLLIPHPLFFIVDQYSFQGFPSLSIKIPYPQRNCRGHFKSKMTLLIVMVVSLKSSTCLLITISTRENFSRITIKNLLLRWSPGDWLGPWRTGGAKVKEFKCRWLLEAWTKLDTLIACKGCPQHWNKSHRTHRSRVMFGFWQDLEHFFGGGELMH